MNHTTKQPGYILVLTIMVLAIAVAIVSHLFYRGSVQVAFDKTIIEREKAKQLAFGGIQLALSQLSVLDTSTTTTQNEKSSNIDPLIESIKKIVPQLNVWQELSLTKEKEGIDGEIKLCIVCENGKIDINQWFDFSKKKFINEGSKDQPDAKKIMQIIFAGMKKFTNDKDLFEVFEKFLKQRQYKLNDISELFEIPEFAKIFKTTLFYEPPQKGDEKTKRPLFLSDVFTIFSGQAALQAWLLSDSILGVLNFNRANPNREKRAKEVEALLKDYSKGMQPMQLWQKAMQTLYGKEMKDIPKEALAMLNPKFEPTVFSVLCYGKVGAIVQKICAIIEKRKTTELNGAPFAIKRLYWL
ncbi:MAG: hypothetical protein BWY54_00018 [Candidatus Dependentiae bacterium ADurb.Bin331]|nr:MAG: hypothetical protein BWY54_00018 [Candidatus Dependentiae bacterium ADurb.Bin331]